MEWNEWNDGDADDPEANHNREFEPWPPAPLPPHERTWRHPSELGATTVQLVARPQPAMSRKATVATVAVGVLLVAGAVRMMVPSGNARTSTSGAQSSLTFVTTSVQEVATTAVAPGVTVPASPAPVVTPAPTFTSLRATTTLVAHVSTTVRNPLQGDVAEFTMLGTQTPTYAVVLNTGRYLATSAAAVSGLDTVQVQMPSGTTSQAVVIHSDGPIALLDLTDSSAAAAPHGEPPVAGDVVTVGSPNGDVQATVGPDNDAGYRLLTSDEPLHESGPVYDADGVVVGICTRSQNVAWLVPVLLLDDLAAQQPTDPPVSTTSAPPSSTTLPASTTSAPTTSTTSTVPNSTATTATPATTKAPTTAAPSTLPPRSTAPPASATPSSTG